MHTTQVLGLKSNSASTTLLDICNCITFKYNTLFIYLGVETVFDSLAATPQYACDVSKRTVEKVKQLVS